MNSEMFSGSVGPLLLVQATLCMAAGLVASLLLRHRAARAHQVLLTALVAAVLMPAGYVAVQHFQMGVLPAEPPPATEPWAAFDMQTVDLLAFETPYETVPTNDPAPVLIAAAPVKTATTPLPWRTICLGGWIAFSTALLGRLALRFALGLRLVKTALPVESARLRQAVESARDRMAVARPVRIRCSNRIKSPIIWCWTRGPVLLVPMGAENQQNTDWVSVFCHELAHLRRRDHACGLFAEMLTALLPWHPLLWWAAARLSQLSEQACDDWVLAGGHNGVDYAETLLGLAAQRQMAFIPTVIGKERTMKARILRIVKDRGGDPRIGGRWAAGIGLLAVLAVVSVGFAQRRPVERRERDRDVSAERPVPEQRRDEAPQWQREVLARKLDELAGQMREKEMLLRRAPDLSAEQRRMQEFELDLLRDMTAQVERRLQDIEPREPEMPLGNRGLNEMRMHVLRQERDQLAQVRRRTAEELESLRDDQDTEAQTLRRKLRELEEQDRGIGEAMADLERARLQLDRERETPREPMEREQAAARTRGRIERIQQEERDRQKAVNEQDLRRLFRRNEEIEQQLRAMGDRDTDESRKLNQERDQIRRRIAEAEEWLARLERESAGPGPEPRGRSETRTEARDPYGDMYGGAYGGAVSSRSRSTAYGRTAQAGRDAIRTTRIYKLQHGNGPRVRELVQSVLGERGQVAADERSGSIVVTTTVEDHQNLEPIIRELDAPAESGDLRNEVEDLRRQMNGLRGQLQEMQELLRQVAERERPGEGPRPSDPIQN